MEFGQGHPASKNSNELEKEDVAEYAISVWRSGGTPDYFPFLFHNKQSHLLIELLHMKYLGDEKENTASPARYSSSEDALQDT